MNGIGELIGAALGIYYVFCPLTPNACVDIPQPPMPYRSGPLWNPGAERAYPPWAYKPPFRSDRPHYPPGYGYGPVPPVGSYLPPPGHIAPPTPGPGSIPPPGVYEERPRVQSAPPAQPNVSAMPQADSGKTGLTSTLTRVE